MDMQVATADEKLAAANILVADTIEDTQKIEKEIAQLCERLAVLAESVLHEKDALPQIDKAEKLAREAIAWATKHSSGMMVPTQETVSQAHRSAFEVSYNANGL
jgi:hypothetical protein